MPKRRVIMPAVKCVTMQRDESILLSAWLRYHGFLFGFDNLTVIDNGSVLPDVLELLDRATQAGVQVYRQFRSEEDYLRKGPITADVIRAIDHRHDYDFLFPLDCDEFIAVWTDQGPSVEPRVIAKALNALDSTSTHFRISNCLYNDPGRPGWFWPQGGQKGFFRSHSIDMLDHGYHTFSNKPDFVMKSCGFTHLHFHHKPFDVQREHSLRKLSPLVDITDAEAVAAHTGPGRHLLRNLSTTPAEYLRQFDDHLTFYFDGFARVAAMLGLDPSSFGASSLDHPPPQGKLRVRWPRDIKGGQTAGQGKEVDFDPSAYLQMHVDVSAAGVNPVTHYLLMGFSEGRPT